MVGVVWGFCIQTPLAGTQLPLAIKAAQIIPDLSDSSLNYDVINTL